MINYASIDSQHVSTERPVDKAPLLGYHGISCLSTVSCFIPYFFDEISPEFVAFSGYYSAVRQLFYQQSKIGSSSC